jgi:hypothetical protein
MFSCCLNSCICFDHAAKAALSLTEGGSPGKLLLVEVQLTGREEKIVPSEARTTSKHCPELVWIISAFAGNAVLMKRNAAHAP